MRKHLNKVVGFAVFAGSLLHASALQAAQDGHGAHAESSSQLLGLAFFTVNFLLFLLVLRRYALPVVREKLRQRRDTVVQALDEAKRAKEAAESLRREYEEKLAGLAAEEERLRVQAQEAAERERARTVEEARHMAERIQHEARLIAQREVEEARRVLRQDVAEQAVRMATELVRAQLTPTDQSRFIEDFMGGVEHAGNNSR